MIRHLTLLVGILGGLWVGCSPKRVDTPEAVRQAVVEYLTGRAGLDLKSMDIQVSSVQFRGDEAEAVVRFRAKGSSDPNSSLELRYTLRREGPRWRVVGRSGSGAAHPGGIGDRSQPLPNPPLPPGHPPISGSTGDNRR